MLLPRCLILAGICFVVTSCNTTSPHTSVSGITVPSALINTLLIQTIREEQKSEPPPKGSLEEFLWRIPPPVTPRASAKYSKHFTLILERQIKKNSTRREIPGIDPIFVDVLPDSQKNSSNPPVSIDEIQLLAEEHNADIVVVVEEIHLHTSYSTSAVTDSEGDIEYNCNSTGEAFVQVSICNAKTGAMIDSHALTSYYYEFETTLVDKDVCYKYQEVPAYKSVAKAAKKIVPLFLPHLEEVANEIFLLVHGVPRNEYLEAKRLAESGDWANAKTKWEDLRERSLSEETKAMMTANIALADDSLYSQSPSAP